MATGNVLRKVAHFSALDMALAILFLAVMMPVHELIHAALLFLFGCSTYLYFDLSYPIMHAGFAHASCSLSYFQQKLVSLAPNVLMGVIGLALVTYGYAKFRGEHARLVHGMEKELRDLERVKASHGRRGLNAIADEIYSENMLLSHASHKTIIFWGIIFIAAVLFSLVLHIFFPISTDWNILGCAPPS